MTIITCHPDTCGACKFYQSFTMVDAVDPDKVGGTCNVTPPEYRSAKEPDKRPRVERNDAACVHYKPSAAALSARCNVCHAPQPFYVDSATGGISFKDCQLCAAVLGYCLVCYSASISREKRPDGNDRCANGHVYKSKHALQSLTPQQRCMVDPEIKPVWHCCENDAHCERDGKTCPNHHSHIPFGLGYARPKVERMADIARKRDGWPQWKRDALPKPFSNGSGMGCPDCGSLLTNEHINGCPHGMRPHGPKVYCYAPQSATARMLAKESGSDYCTIIPIRDAQDLRGIAGGVFLIVEGHMGSLPVSVYSAAMDAGMLQVVLSDSWLRAKAERLRSSRK